MKQIIYSKSIVLIFIMISLYSCKKDTTGGSNNNNNNNNGPAKTCYPITITTQYSTGTTMVQKLFYDANHEVNKVITQQAGSEQAQILSRSSGQLRVDSYYSENGVTRHTDYDIYYVNGSNKADSITSFECVDCNLDEPTSFKRINVQQLFYSGDKLVKSQAKVVADLDSLEPYYYYYDNKGRLAQSVGGYLDGDTSIVTTLIYSSDESKIFKLSATFATQDVIFGDSFSYSPQTTIIKNVGAFELTKFEWTNIANKDGYIASASAAITRNGIAVGTETMTYEYDCF